MAHFAEVDENNVVLRVLVTDNNDPNGDEGYQWLIDNLGGTWIKTSYNGKIRKNFAGIGFTYNEELDSFVAPQPYPSWKLDKRNSQWKAPVAYPADGLSYFWSESKLDWELSNSSESE
jgi:hypothetical protein